MDVFRLKGTLLGLKEACNVALGRAVSPIEIARFAADLLVIETEIRWALKDVLPQGSDATRMVTALNDVRIGATEIAERLADPPLDEASLNLSWEYGTLTKKADRAFKMFDFHGDRLLPY